MAVGHRTVRNINRDLVAGWIATWKGTPQPKPSMRQYIRQQLEAVQPGISDQTIDTSARDDYPDDDVPLLQLIMDDVKSYA